MLSGNPWATHERRAGCLDASKDQLMTVTKFKFTKAAIEAMDLPEKRTDFRDTATPGLTLRVSPHGRKVFYFYRKIGGRQERVKIGQFPTISVDAAQSWVKELAVDVIRGINPAELKRKVKAEPTLKESFEDFIKLKRNSRGQPLSDATIISYRTTFDKHLAKIGKLKISKVSPDDLRTLKIASDAQSNRVRAMVSAVFTWMINEQGYSSLVNPAAAIKHRAIDNRKRFLQPEELPRFFEALECNSLGDFFALCLWTGARKMNVAAMEWSQVDLVRGVWVIPKTKNGDAHSVPLTGPAIEILRKRKMEKNVNIRWVFPGRGTDSHLREPKRAWRDLLEEAGLSNLRIHDLRRSMGSYLAIGGESLTVVGKALGHRSHQASAIYAQLNLDPVRQAIEKATASISAAAKVHKNER